MARDGIDIAIRTAANLPDTMVAKQLGSLGRALYAAPEYLAGAGTPAHPDELQHHRLITNSAATQLPSLPSSPARGSACPRSKPASTTGPNGSAGSVAAYEHA
jgi:hypothetical protein